MDCTHKSTSATTMSINHSDLSKKLRKAAINQAVAELMSAKQSLAHGNKRLAKNKDNKVAIGSLQQFGVSISKDALHQRVVMAFKSSVPDILKEINVLTPPSSVTSTLTPQTSTAHSPTMTSPTTATTLMNATSPVTKAG
jgi:hypothetical protein